MDNNQNNRDNGDGKKSGPSATLILLIISIVLTLVFWQQYNAYKTSGEEEVSYDEFINMIEKKEVEKVEIYNDKIYFTPKEQSDITILSIVLQKPTLNSQKLMKAEMH